jgi:hypothetical protein
LPEQSGQAQSNRIRLFSLSLLLAEDLGLNFQSAASSESFHLNSACFALVSISSPMADDDKVESASESELLTAVTDLKRKDGHGKTPTSLAMYLSRLIKNRARRSLLAAAQYGENWKGVLAGSAGYFQITVEAAAYETKTEDQTGQTPKARVSTAVGQQTSRLKIDHAGAVFDVCQAADSAFDLRYSPSL